MLDDVFKVEPTMILIFLTFVLGRVTFVASSFRIVSPFIVDKIRD